MFCFKISTTHTGKVNDSQVISLEIIYHNFVPYTLLEGEYREYLRHLIVKARRWFEHGLNVYFWKDDYD